MASCPFTVHLLEKMSVSSPYLPLSSSGSAEDDLPSSESDPKLELAITRKIIFREQTMLFFLFLYIVFLWVIVKLKAIEHLHSGSM